MALLNLSCGEKQTDDIRQCSELLSFPTVTCFELKQLLTVLQSNQKSYPSHICHTQFVKHFFKWVNETENIFMLTALEGILNSMHFNYFGIFSASWATYLHDVSSVKMCKRHIK